MDSLLRRFGSCLPAKLGRFFAGCAFFLTAHVLGAADTSAAAAEELKINNSTCTVQFGVRDDRFFVADFVQWQLSPRFKKEYAGFKWTDGDPAREREVERKLQEELRLALNRALELDLPLSLWAQGDAAVAQHARDRRKPARETLTWEQAKDRFRPTGTGASLADMILNTVGDPSVVTVNQLFDHCLVNDTPFRKFTTSSFQRTDAALKRLQDKGQMRFRLLDPVSDQDISTGIVFRQSGRNVGRSAFDVSREDLAQLLHPLAGRLWSRREIAVRITDYYRQRGAAANEAYHLVKKISSANDLLAPSDPDVTPEAPADVLGGLWAAKLQDDDDLLRVEFADGYARRNGRFIYVLEPPPIEAIALGPLSTPGADTVSAQEAKTQWQSLVGKLYHSVLDDARWEQFLHSSWFDQTEADPATNAVLPLSLLSADAQGSPNASKMYLLDEDLAHRTGALTQLGFGAKQEDTTLWIRRLPPKTTEEELGPPENRSAQAAVGDVASADDVTASDNANALPPDESEDAGNPPRAQPIRAKTPVVRQDREHLNSAGLKLTQHTGRGLEAAGSYARKLGDKTTALAFTFGQWEKPFGSAKVEKDYLFFDELDRRWLVNFEPFSDFEPDKKNLGGTTDERRTGARLYSEIDLLHARSGHWLRLTFEGAREKLKAAPAAGAPSVDRYDSSANGGLIWYWRHPTKLSSPDVTVGANYKTVHSSVQSFDITSVNFRYHQHVSDFMQFELSGAGFKASAGTPLTDQPQLGGTSTVRGYRDAVIAAPEVAFAQAEYWLPLRGLESRYPSFGSFWRRQYVAVFADIGRARDATATQTIAGTGIGLRLNLAANYSFKLDLARGLRSTRDARAKTAFHFDVVAAFPL